MSSLENAFSKAVAVINDQRGKPAILGKADGTLYWVDPSGMTHRTRVWARIGEQASNQEVVVDCLRASPQMDMPVRVDHKNGRLTVIEEDGQRAIEFSGNRPGAGVGAHAWLHSRLGPDPVYIEGLQFLPLLVTPTSPPDLTVTVQAGAYTDSAGDLAIHDTAVSGSFSAFVPGTGHHFVIVCLDRTDGSIVLVDGDDVTVTDALFGDAVVTAADIEAVTISADYKPLAVVLLYAAQTQIKTRDIIKDLRKDGGVGTVIDSGVASFGASGVVINNAEADRDFRIAGNGVTNGYFYDAGNDRHGFGTGTPSVTIDVVGGDISISNTGASAAMLLNRTDGAAMVMGGGFAQSAMVFDDTQAFDIRYASRASVEARTLNAGSLAFRIDGSGRVAIGGSINTSSILALTSTTGALLLPRMTTTQQNALTAVNGMLIFNSSTGKFRGYAGGWVDLH